jgi:glycosyltransferase involved in cell wall biosynthesis
MKVSIIIPAYNEEKRIGKTLEEYSEFFNNLKTIGILDYEILIVINNTKDRTEEIVKVFQRENKNIRYLNLKMGGKGLAIIEGFKDSLSRKNDLIGFVDADMATPPNAYYDLIKNISNSDGIIASRYIKNSIVSPKQSIQRIIVSRIFNFMIRSLFLFPYADTQCGAKLFKRESIKKIIKNLGLTQWAFDVDLLYQAKIARLAVTEFPTIWADKEYSKINFIKAGPRMVLSSIRLRIMYSPFRRLIKLYLLMPKWIRIDKR